MFGGLPPRFPSDSISNDFLGTDANLFPEIQENQVDAETGDQDSQQHQSVAEEPTLCSVSIERAESPESELNPVEQLHQIVQQRRKTNNDKVTFLQKKKLNHISL
jgi:hypothetical protein